MLRTIIGICKLCRREHSAALLEVLTLPELQPSAERITVREPETSPSSSQEQASEVSFLLSIFAWSSWRRGKRNAPALYYNFRNVHFYTSIRVIPTPQLPAGADDLRSEARSYASQEVGPEVTPTQQLPVRADDASSEAFSSASQESVPEVETSLKWQSSPQVQHRLHYLNNFLRNSADGSQVPFDLSFVQMSWICPLSQVANTNVTQCKQ